VRLGVNETSLNYEQTESDGIAVFYQAAIAATFKKVTIKLEKILFLKNLSAAGER
jgi:hypothetical protein